jgi:hypothetical protein
MIIPASPASGWPGIFRDWSRCHASDSESQMSLSGMMRISAMRPACPAGA